MFDLRILKIFYSSSVGYHCNDKGAGFMNKRILEFLGEVDVKIHRHGDNVPAPLSTSLHFCFFRTFYRLDPGKLQYSKAGKNRTVLGRMHVKRFYLK